jgi:hypothetical protein
MKTLKNLRFFSAGAEPATGEMNSPSPAILDVVNV